MRFNTVLAVLGTLAVAAATLPAAQAAPVSLRLSGSVTSADADNPFNIGAGQLLSGEVTFDSALLTGSGTEFLNINSDPALRLEIQIGDFAFNETDDAGFGQFPMFQFVDGEIIDIDFIVSLDRVSRFVIVDQDGGERTFSFEVQIPGEENRLVITGTFDFVGEPEPISVPEPAALVLFGAGLAGLGLMRRRRA